MTSRCFGASAPLATLTTYYLLLTYVEADAWILGTYSQLCALWLHYGDTYSQVDLCSLGSHSLLRVYLLLAYSQVDLWSLGITAMELAERKPPHAETTSVFKVYLLWRDSLLAYHG